MKTEIVLLCEDRQTDAFVRRFLKRRFKSPQIQTVSLPPANSPASNGSGVSSLQYERHCEPMVKRLYTMCHEAQRLDDPYPPSPLKACGEYQRLSANAPQA